MRDVAVCSMKQDDTTVNLLYANWHRKCSNEQ